MQHHRQKDTETPASNLAGQIAVSVRLLVATVVGACSSVFKDYLGELVEAWLDGGENSVPVGAASKGFLIFKETD
jgi:hypothetical protein